jgi:hypothetical protein
MNLELLGVMMIMYFLGVSMAEPGIKLPFAMRITLAVIAGFASHALWDLGH